MCLQPEFFLVRQLHFFFNLYNFWKQRQSLLKVPEKHIPPVHSSWQTAQSEGHHKRNATCHTRCTHIGLSLKGTCCVRSVASLEHTEVINLWCMLRTSQSSFQNQEINVTNLTIGFLRTGAQLTSWVCGGDPFLLPREPVNLTHICWMQWKPNTRQIPEIGIFVLTSFSFFCLCLLCRTPRVQRGPGENTQGFHTLV